MEVIVNSEYQDIYRVKDGVLLVVNKFKQKFPEVHHVYTYNIRTGKYKKECQDILRILKQEYYDKYNNISLPKGTVLYGSMPIEPSKDKSCWEYQIKTTGALFSGDEHLMNELLSDILSVIKIGMVV